TIPDGVREVHEELGLPLVYGDLHPIGLRQTAVTLAPDYIEREFQHWHLLPLDVALEAIPLADAEVSGLVDIDLDDALALADGDTDTISAHYATRTDTGLEYGEATLARADLVPNYLTLDQLYLRLFVAARRFCAGERTHVFW
ncbi:MAG: NUDIX hydrolase, partial [Sciscionella sp.]